MTGAGPGSRAAECRDHLVGDEKDPVPVADVPHHRHEALMRGHDAAGTEDGFHDEGSDGARPLERDLVLERRRAKTGQPLRIGFVERIAVRVRCRDVMAAGQQRLVGGTETRISVDAGAAHVGSVVTLLEAEELHATGFASQLVVLPGQPQCHLHAVRSAGCEEAADHALFGKELPQPEGEFDDRVIGGSAKDGIVRKPVELTGDGLFHGGVGETEIDVPESTHSIKNDVSVNVHEPDAPCAHDDLGRVAKALRRMRHRMPEMAGVVSP